MLNPTIFFFIAGITASALKVGIKIPRSIYELITMFLLITIGIKGGIELTSHSFLALAPKIALVLAMGVMIPFIAYPILRKLGNFNNIDAASIAAHYGSVSVGTYAVSISFLQQLSIPFESYTTLFLVILEFPAILVGIVLAKGFRLETVKSKGLAREIFLGKSIFLLLLGFLVGALFHRDYSSFLTKYFMSNFDGVLALFLFEMGMVTTKELKSFLTRGRFLFAFGIMAPMLFAMLGLTMATIMGLSTGGKTIMATLAASASYIAVPAAMQSSLPDANPSLSLGTSLGITFPFNITIGIPLYYKVVQFMN